ncbi:hypothetical protein IE53DRAFT_373620 [Violaceomyces palustris]|uniref:Uncharacterized protein n=1 Tax=Violaceomyces palustris TaxID=1673888 RepID=A0ACD0P2S5_9BASI|nr:hypothetical protein IE53DRAFT_373620 [Violaceomyces palustris]
MRAVVASESPVWISSFIEFGGYSAMLARLEELLGMEWREEQHDDQLLHELLRCFVALATTEIGKGALQSRAPSPFKELVELLFSEKKPGDLSTRKLMVDLLAILFELELPDKAGVTLQRDTSITKPSQFKTSSCSRIAKAAGINSAPSLLVTLLHNPRDPSVEAVVDFITASHTPRPFKTYLLELSGVCRDYFWIFCHSQNRFWRLEDVDQEKVSGPKVPGGMTGGVEFEAMGYLTSHMKLINMIGHSLLESMAAYEFHANLFASGIERILQTLRRSSQHYYSPMHLELSRYLSLAHHSKYLLPADLLVWLAPAIGAT